MKNIKKITVKIFFFLIIPCGLNAQTYFTENFEEGIPSSWTEEYIVKSFSWRIENGGYEDYGESFPNAAKSGVKNAVFQIEGPLNRGAKTKLITDSIDLSGAQKPELTFWNSQQEWGPTDFDRLRVYCKEHKDSSWYLMEEYLEPDTEWTLRSLFLPDSLLSETFYIAFEGESNYGYGTCVDSIEIIERGIIPMHITNFAVQQANAGFATYHSTNTPILRLEFNIFGNTGKLKLDSLNIQFNGNDISDIEDSGVKLFYTKKNHFLPHNQIGSSMSFSSSNASFTGLNYEIPYGTSYLWVTYNLDSLSQNGNSIDGILTASSVDIEYDTTGTSFTETFYIEDDSIVYIVDNDTNTAPLRYNIPTTDIDPAGEAYIRSELYFDDFETDTLWEVLQEDFEINKPLGRGANGNVGFPDPDTAFQGSQVLGTDLSIDGDYVANHPTFYYAQTKRIDAYYYKNIHLGYQLWLNKETWDDFNISVSADSGQNWTVVKNYAGDISQDYWSFEDINLSALNLDRLKNLFLRVNTKSDVDNVSSGWNIDNLVLAGDYIDNDIAVTEFIAPGSGCGHSASDSVTVKIKNHGPTICKDTIPIFYSFYGNDSIVYDTIFNAGLAPEDSMIFTFSKRIDLTDPGLYNVIVSADLPSDEYRINDTVETTIFVQPTLDLPYAENFETTNGVWLADGNENSTWEWGEPDDGAQSGLRSWATKLLGNYKNQDSSWLETVCFNFADTSPKVIDFYYKLRVEEAVDGALMEYSVNGGETWNYLDTHNYSFDWPWYNDTIVSFNGTLGWSDNNSSWVRGRQVLPDLLDEEPQVKLRVRFQSDTANTDKGVFLDNFKIYKAPYDIGVVSVDSISDACQGVNSGEISFTVKNFGIGGLLAGDTIIFGIDATNNTTIIDTLVITQNLDINDSVVLKANKKIDLSQSGSYDISVYTLIEDDPFYYWPVSNDTAEISITIHPNPQTGLPDTIPTARPDTLVLKPIYDVDFAYLWQPDNVTDSVYHVTVEGDVYLTVTNTGPTGCITWDTLNVKKLIPDVSVDSLSSPISTCEFGSEVFIDIDLRNTGTDTLEVNDTIYITYEFEGLTLISDTFYLSERFYPDSVLTFTVDNQSVDMSSLDSIYNFKIYSDYRWDTTRTNDTLLVAVESYGYPTVEILNDLGVQMPEEETVYVLEKILNAGPTFETYLWSTGDTTQRDTITETGYYSVTITDEHGCPDRDSVYIKFDYLDIGVTAVVFPQSSCAPLDSFNVQIELTNTGTDTVYLGSNLDVGYKLNTNPQVDDILTLEDDLLPDEVLIYEFKQKEWIGNPTDSVEITVEAFTLVGSDINTANDSITTISYFYENPVFELGEDTLVKAESYTLSVNETEHFSYSWNTGSDSASTEILVSGEYTLTVTSPKGCETVDTRKVTIVQPDLEVIDIVSPVSDCMPSDSVSVEMTVLNSGTDTLFIGDTVKAGYQLNEGSIYREDIILSSDLRPNMQINYQFNQKVKFIQPGEKRFVTFVDIDEDLYRDNDNFKDTIEIYTYPVVELGNDTLIKTTSYSLVANNDPTYSYNWSNGGSDSTISVSSDGTYSVTVTTTEGCSTEDEITLQFTFPNIGVITMTEPTDLCGQEQKMVAINVKNLGTDTLEIGDEVEMGYKVNDGTFINEQIVLSQRILPGDTIKYNFNNMVDMSEAGAYLFKIFTNLERDLLQIDDTLTKTLNILEAPVVDFNKDAVNDTFTTDLPITLDAGAGFIKYVWNDDQRLRLHIIDDPGWYEVTVTNANGCTGSGGIYIAEKTSECDTCCGGNCCVDTCDTYVDQLLDNQLSLSIYPNPAQDELFIDFNAKKPGRIIIQLFNTQGKAVLNKQTDIIQYYKEIVNTKNLPQGVYVLQVIYNNKTRSSYRILKQ